MSEEKKEIVDPKEWKVEWLDPNTLTPYERNARKNDATVPYLVNSIRRFGFKVPLVIDKEGVVVCGHTRLKAALQIGYTKVPCVRATDLTDAEIKAFRLADNKVQELSGWDYTMLEEQLEELKIDFDEDMIDFGFTEINYDEPLFERSNEEGEELKEDSFLFSVRLNNKYKEAAKKFLGSLDNRERARNAAIEMITENINAEGSENGAE